MLTPLCEHIWQARHDLKMPPPGVYFNCRMSVVRLQDGSVLVHSPVPIDEECAAQIRAIGPVSHLIAPSLFHHLFMPQARALFPDATLWGAPGLGEKRPDITFDATLTRDPFPLSEELSLIFIEGVPSMNEVVFFHHPSRSLLVTDYIFNILHPTGALTPAMLTIMNANKKLAQSRLWRMICKDRQAFGQSAQAIMALPFERLIMAHGEVLEGPDTHARVRQALSWALAGVS